MKRLLTIIATSAALVLSSCSTGDIPLPGGADTGDNPIRVQIEFRDVLDLVAQSSVKIDDVNVGRVVDIELGKDNVALVTVEIPGDSDLPANTRAQIRQTSLLGEKFVALAQPDQPRGELQDGDTIPLANSGRNPELEEVFEAMALLLNGGGVAQLKAISQELNLAFEGREDDFKSLIRESNTFLSQVDANKSEIIRALENVNRLAKIFRKEDPTLKAALDDFPRVLESVDGQRDDLVKMLGALQNLSGVGVRVIQASKAATIDSLQSLSPVLAKLAEADDALPNSLRLLLTIPFPDDIVGVDPQAARDLQMGDYVNLHVNLTLDLFNLPNIPGLPGVSIADIFDQCSATPAAPLCAQVQELLSPTALTAVCEFLAVLCPPGAGDGNGGSPLPRQQSGAGTGTSASGSSASGALLGDLLGGSTTPEADAPATQSPGETESPTPQAPAPQAPADTGKGSGWSLLGSLLGGRKRAATGYDGRDLFLLSGTGYDPGLGTLLLQGVAYK